MSEIEIEELFKEAIELWGVNAQVNIAIEESSELIQAFCKMLRGHSQKRYYNLCEEMADVEITISQMKQIFNVDDNVVNMIKEKKLKKLRDKVEKYKKCINCIN